MAGPRRRCVLAALAAPLALAGGGAPAATWPTRPLTWVVPFGPGGITDTSSHVVAQRLGAVLGQPVVVENRAGAGGTVGTEAVARAAPDGYTLLYGTQNTHAVALAMFPGLRYHPQRDFLPVHGLGAAPNLLVTHPSRPWRSVAELVEHARRHPEAVTCASAGIGTAGHLAAELVQATTGIRLTHAPYASPAQALNDLIAGRVDIMFDYPLTSLPHVREGRLRTLGLTTDQRLPLAPEIPPLGLPGVEMLAWAGLFVPARTPAGIVATLEGATTAALRDPAAREFFEGTGTLIWAEMGAEALGRFVAAEIPRARDLVLRAGLRPG